MLLSYEKPAPLSCMPPLFAFPTVAGSGGLGWEERGLLGGEGFVIVVLSLKNVLVVVSQYLFPRSRSPLKRGTMAPNPCSGRLVFLILCVSFMLVASTIGFLASFVYSSRSPLASSIDVVRNRAEEGSPKSGITRWVGICRGCLYLVQANKFLLVSCVVTLPNSVAGILTSCTGPLYTTMFSIISLYANPVLRSPSLLPHVCCALSSNQLPCNVQGL
mmetsp:Transcript_47965/g.150479  ORF Transcript_47965/g.150479 Transcript_47965/m.150479 type:complete len:217 (+) Transcript_47965:577-1227(+)